MLYQIVRIRVGGDAAGTAAHAARVNKPKKFLAIEKRREGCGESRQKYGKEFFGLWGAAKCSTILKLAHLSFLVKVELPLGLMYRSRVMALHC